MQARERDWNPEALTGEFSARAENAERYLNEVRAKLHLSNSYELVYDQTLAEFCAFNYFHGRTFLDTRDSLLSALQEFMAFDVQKPAGVFDFNRFLTFRKNIAQHLIQRFQDKE